MRKPDSWYEKFVPVFHLASMIPRVLVQTVRDRNLSEEIQTNIKTLKSNNPDWDYILFLDKDVEDFILKEYGADMVEYYRRIDGQYGAAKADFFRYLYIYRNGGVYLDIKSSFTKPLSPLVQSNDLFLTSHWDNLNGPHKGFGLNYSQLSHIEGGEYLQCCIMSAAGHPYLRAVILSMLKRIDEYSIWKDRVGHDAVFFTTGPNMYSLAIQTEMDKRIDSKLHRVVDYFNDFGYVYSILEEQENNPEAHKVLFKSHYRDAWHPLIKHHSSLIHHINLLMCLLYHKYLMLRYK